MSNRVRFKYSSIKIDRYFAIDLISFVYIFFLISGYTSDNSIYISAVLFAFWLIVAFFTNLNYSKKTLSDVKSLLLLFYLTYGFICGLIGGEVVFSLKQFGAGIIMFSPIYLYNYYYHVGKTKLLHMLYYSFAIIVLFSVRAIVFYTQNVGSARMLVENSQVFGKIAIGGGYVIAYASALIISICTSVLVERKTVVWQRIVFIMMIAVGIVVLIKTTSTITIICAVLGGVFALIFKNYEDDLSNTKKNKTFMKIFIFTIAGFVSFFLLINHGIIGKLILAIAERNNTIIGIRLRSLGNALISQGDSDYALGRFSLPIVSFKTFLSKPLFGVAYLHGNGFYSSLNYGVAQHCEWADALANYGLWGGVPFLLIYINQVRAINKKHSHIGNAWAICLLFLGLFNPFRSFTSHFVVFFVLPVVNMVFYEKKLDANL